MKKKTISILTLTLSAALLTSDCVLKPAEKVDTGVIEGTTYSNKYFGMTLMIPDKWLAHSTDDTSSMRKAGADLIAGDNKGMKDKIEAEEANVVQLISISRYPLNYTGGFNASLQCTAEKLGLLSGVSNSKDYIANFKKVMSQAQGQLKYTLGDDTYTQSIGGIDFTTLDVQGQIGQLSIDQKLCVSVMKGYALAFIITYASNDDLAVLDGVLKSVSFSAKH
jgi:hypothetical protein